MDEPQARMARHVSKYNSDPVVDFEGFSPNEMDYLLYRPFDDRSPMYLGSFEEVVGLLKDVLIYLKVLSDVSPVKLTAKGNLPRALVREMVSKGVDDNGWWSIPVENIQREEEAPNVFLMDHITRDLQYVVIEKGKLILSKKGQGFLEERKKEDMKSIFKFYITGYNWAYEDRMRRSGFLQAAFPFVVFCLQKYGSQWRDIEFYTNKFLKAFPNVLYDFENEYGEPEKEFEQTFERRIVRRFLLRFALVEVQEKDEGYREIEKIKKTPLLDKVIKWR